MLEARIPKEIRTYKEKLIAGMTLRQCICTVLALAINIPLYLGLSKVIGDDAAGWVIMFTGTPFILMGYLKLNGMEFETFIKCFVQFEFFSQKRVYRTENLYAMLDYASQFDQEDDESI